MKSINEMIMDELIAHSLFSGRYGTGVARKMVKALNEFDAELTASLIVALDDTNSGKPNMSWFYSTLRDFLSGGGATFKVFRG